MTALVAAGSAGPFHAGAASQYAHQISDQVTIGAKSLSTGGQVADVFGKKVDLLKYGVLPVLVVIENKRQQTLDLRDVEVNLVAADGRHVSSVNPEDVPFLGTAGHHPHKSPVPLPIPLPGKKNPLNSPEIVTRAFSAKMLPPGDSASGFFYFEAKPEAGDSLYLNGLRDTPSGREILYFEFPIDK
ncbi:MAG: hypothetical protein M3Y57_20070 [Acidobacteriota bacterium]|nr:hypothetical protein [Acidobacteriota bacterium]